jgi:hypothetical protein
MDRKKAASFCGKGVQLAVRGKFVHANNCGMDKEEFKKVASLFVPKNFFDADCPHCKPFLDDGAIIMHNSDDVIGVRLFGNGMYEVVMLKKPAKAEVAHA